MTAYLFIYFHIGKRMILVQLNVWLDYPDAVLLKCMTTKSIHFDERMNIWFTDLLDFAKFNRWPFKFVQILPRPNERPQVWQYV